MDHREILGHFVALFCAILLAASGQSLAQDWGDAPITYAYNGCGAGNSYESSSIATTGGQICAAHPNGNLSFVSATSSGPDTFLIICSGGTEASPNTAAMYQCRKCPSGSVIDANNKCISSLCLSQSGQSFSFDKVQDGTACSGPSPESVCFPNGCRGIVVSGSRMGFTNANGSSACLFDGVARVSSALPCQSTDTAVKLASSSAVQQDEQAASAGGIGLSGQGTQSLDSINLARIATNTAKIAGTLSGGTGTGGTGTGTGASFEGEEGTPLSEGAAFVAGAIEENQVPSNAPLLASPPDVGSASRWLLNLATFRGNYAAQCAHSWTVQLPVIGEQHFELDFCPWAQYVKTFLYWAFGIWTAYALWSTVYSSQRKA